MIASFCTAICVFVNCAVNTVTSDMIIDACLMSTWTGQQVEGMPDYNSGLRVLAVCCQYDRRCIMITGCLFGRGPETGLVGRGSPEVRSNQEKRFIIT